jgi:hypothetical protein
MNTRTSSVRSRAVSTVNKSHAMIPECDPAVTRDRPARGREEDPVDGPEPGRARGPPEHPELMAEDKDLEVLGAVVSTRLSGADEETHEGRMNR